MLLAPSYCGTKIGAILYGLAAGMGVFVVIVFASALLGVFVDWFSSFTGWISLGEYGAWLPIMLGEYSLIPGLVVAVIVCWKIWKSRLGSGK